MNEVMVSDLGYTLAFLGGMILLFYVVYGLVWLIAPVIEKFEKKWGEQNVYQKRR